VFYATSDKHGIPFKEGVMAWELRGEIGVLLMFLGIFLRHISADNLC